MEKKLPLIIIAAMFVFLVFACENSLSVQSNNSSDTGGLSVTVDGSMGRSILPTDMTISNYRITGSGPRGAVLTAQESTTGSFTVSSLITGEWTITVEGYDGANKLLVSGSSSVTIKSGETSTVSIILTPAAGGKGNVELSVIWTGVTDRTIETITGSLTPENGAAIPLTFSINGSTATCVKSDITAGSYIFTASIKTSDLLIARTLTETVLIYNGKTSSGSFPLTGADFGPDYRVTYNANGAENGTAPTDAYRYVSGASVTLATNSGNMTRTNLTFVGWNTRSDGLGTTYAPGATITIGNADIPLYAVWAITYSITYDSNDATSGTVPVDSQVYVEGSTVTILGNSGNLTKPNYILYGWNTMANGTGTQYRPGDTFAIGAANVTLYPRWIRTVSLVCTGYDHTMILCPDGTLWGCGKNSNYQLCNGTRLNQSTPIQIMSDVQSVSAGESYTMILKTDGTLWACGDNSKGQLGNGSTTRQKTPIQIMSDVQSVSAGFLHTMILKTDGTLWACGDNEYGELGDGTSTAQSTPVQIMSDVQSVSAGYFYTMILKTDDTLWACGSNIVGELGDGTTTNRSTPEQIMSGVQSVFAGGGHTMILKPDNTLWSWGYNGSGQLGDGTTMDRSIPVQIMSDVKLVGSGGDHTMILKTDGTLWACGDNSKGQLGDGTTTNRSMPEQIMSGVQSVSSGAISGHTMILLTDGTFWGCGWNRYGRLGDGTNTDRLTPVQITIY